MKSFVTKSAKERSTLTKEARGVWSIHDVADDRTHAQNVELSERQRALIDVVLNGSGNTKEATPAFMSGASPILDILMRPAMFTGDARVMESDKKLLMDLWDNSSLVETNERVVASGGNRRVKVSSNVSAGVLNRLRAAGLVSGTGEELVITEKGRQVLVKAMLDDNSALEKTASSLKKLVKLAQSQKLQGPSGNVELVRTPDGRWVAKSQIALDKIQREVSTFSTAKIKSLMGVFAKAEQDATKYRTAGSSDWDSQFDMAKLMAVKKIMATELSNRGE